MRKLVLGNWKLHGSKTMVESLLAKLSLVDYDANKITVGVLPPFVYLSQAQTILAASPIKLGAQNVSEHEQGAFTGEVAAAMLKEFGCDHVLVGHSERRHIFHENNEQVATKFWRAIDAGLIPVLCVGETLAQREMGQAEAVIGSQLMAVFGVDRPINTSQFVIAYEPVWAIGTGKTASLEQVQQVHQFIHTVIDHQYFATVKGTPVILYGGSVKSDNAHQLMRLSEVQGVLVGGASIDAEQFTKIIAAATGV